MEDIRKPETAAAAPVVKTPWTFTRALKVVGTGALIGGLIVVGVVIGRNALAGGNAPAAS